MAAFPASRYNVEDHRRAEMALFAANRRVNKARARRAAAAKPSERREWNRSTRAAERDAARALELYLLAEAIRPMHYDTAA